MQLSSLPVFAALTLACSATLAAGSDADKAFVSKVSQGGMYEVAASKLAAKEASTQDVRDFAVAEVHDHSLVGAKLQQTASAAGLRFPHQPNAEFSRKLAELGKLSGPAFDAAYMNDMATIHDADGDAFLRESENGGDEGLKAFASETHVIVLRHIGAIHAAPPPAAK